MIDLPLDPTDEELARDWTLTAADLVQVRRCRGDDKRHSFALQLCVLRQHGLFLGDDYSKVPVRIINHIGAATRTSTDALRYAPIARRD